MQWCPCHLVLFILFLSGMQTVSSMPGHQKYILSIFLLLASLFRTTSLGDFLPSQELCTDSSRSLFSTLALASPQNVPKLLTKPPRFPATPPHPLSYTDLELNGAPGYPMGGTLTHAVWILTRNICLSSSVLRKDEQVRRR